ncbi:RWD domain protein [Ancylostoma duodenale]|uniref:RWD domain protein n=1 Tax=Ancylostoma duodenale TaxID=51022 RepID=A0A0C2D1N4_9BILA|nr:RWD domain protein [Ancylostoma duodenale]
MFDMFKDSFNMSCDTREEQLAEVEALKSVYDESRVVIDDDPLVCGRISIEMEPLSKPLTVVANTEQGRHSAELSTLPPLNLVFRLPLEYPVVSPELSIECEWMDDSLISVIENRLADVCKENLGMSVLYFCCETVIEIVQGAVRELTEICLDSVPYGKKHEGYERYERILLDRALDQMADVVPCPRKTCQNPVLVSER